MFCKNCGTKMDDDMMFCPNCGTQNDDTEATVSINSSNSPIFDDNTQNSANDQTQGVSNNPYTPQNNNFERNGEGYSDNFQNFNQGNSQYPAKSTISTVSKIFSVLLAILFFALSFYTVIVGVVRLSFSEENLNKILNDVTISKIEIKDDNEEKTISDFIYDMIDYDVIDEYNISVRKIADLLDDEEVTDFIDSTIIGFVGYIIDGTEYNLTDEDDILDFIESIEDEIYDATGYQMTEKDYEYLEDELDNGSLRFLTPEGRESNLPLDVFSFIISVPMMIVSIILLIIIIVLILFLNKWSFKTLFAYIGTPLTILGALLLLMALALLIVIASGALSFIEVFISPLIASLSLFGAVLLGIGLLMVIIYAVFFRSKREK